MSPGPPPKLTVDETVRIMQDANRPFWSEKQFAERADVSKPTARDRLREAVSRGEIAETNANGGSVYYVPGKTMQRVGKNSQPIKSDLKAYWNGHFVGNPQEPSVVSTFQGTHLTAGEEAKFLVGGRPGNWDYYEAAHIEESIEWLNVGPPGGYTAIITGKLYQEPTVPIEQIEYPDDYNVELNIGGEYHQIEGSNRLALVVSGPENHLVKPCNNALFLQDVAVERLEGPGPELKDINVIDLEKSLRDTNYATILRHREP